MEAIIKKLINYIISDQNISKLFVKQIYNLRHGSKSYIRTIKDLTSQKKNIIKTFFPKGLFTSHLPKFNLGNEKITTTEIPSISLFKFDDAIINVNSSVVVYRKKILVTRTEGERFNEGFLKIHDTKNGKIYSEETESLEEGFFLAGNGSWNWFHYIIEILPKLILLQKKYTTVLLVNEIVTKIPSMQKLLEILNDDLFEIKYLSKNKTYQVKNLYYVNDFNHVQFNRFDEKIQAKGTYYNFKLTEIFSNKILNKVEILKNLPTHIFLYRKETHRISRNQDEISTFLVSNGFTLVCMEELTIEEQISYFYNAKFIVGITGAAWANVIFCRNSPKAICFVPEIAKDSVVYSSLAENFYVDFFEQSYTTSDKFHTSDFIIDLDKFQKLYETLNEK